ncbi:MAG: dihydropteroate synthase [Bacteroidetes bacterium]|nr:dihydropteroate synthase [Bacteroidota bacterium]
MKSKNKNINLSINCNGKLVDLNTPKVMGVLNITPDSFYDGGRYKDAKSILNQTEKLISEGATFLDIGAYSSRPGADFISENEELQRIVPVVELIQKKNPDVLISVDSFRAKVIRECVSAGAVISNDISAGKLDTDMIKTVGELGVPYIMMHMRGTPQTMKNLITYQHLINEIYAYFSKQIELARQHHITDIIIDPGFGFAKTLAQNYELLKQMEFFKNLNCPILTGVSRKSMIYKVLGCTANEALNGTTALNMAALMNGACILRVHDVKEAVECIKLFNQL